MHKIYIPMLLLTCTLYADQFTRFLDLALQNSPALQAADIRIAQSAWLTRKETRLQNPRIEGRVAGYDQKRGYALGLSQEIPFPQRQKELRTLGDKRKSQARLKRRLLHARIVSALSQKYLTYRQKYAFWRLSLEEKKLAKKIFDIAASRYHAGTIAKREYLRARLAYHRSEQQTAATALQKEQAYYTLLAEAGITEEIALTGTHRFTLQHTARSENPELALLHAGIDVARYKARVDSRKVTSFSLFTEYEKEPDQDIVRAGIRLPVALFNRGEAERKIASLSIRQRTYAIERYKAKNAILQKRLRRERTLLLRLRDDTRQLLREQRSMLKMLEEGYKIANVNLLELQEVKNSMIQTRKRSIEIATKLDLNTIRQNYLNGVYND